MALSIRALMSTTTTCVFFVSSSLLLLCVVLSNNIGGVGAMTVQNREAAAAVEDNCVLSFVVPRDRMKSSCDFEEKFRRQMSAVEMKLNVYKKQTTDLQTMLSKERELNAQKMDHLERLVRESSIGGNNGDDSPSDVRFDQRLTDLEQEVGRLSNDIVHAGRSVHAHAHAHNNRNAIEDPLPQPHPDYNFNALDQNPVTLPNLVKSMVQAEIQSVMDDYTKRFEKYVQEQMVIYSKVYSLMAAAEPSRKTEGGLQGRLNGQPARGAGGKYPEQQLYKEFVSESIMDQLNDFRDNIDRTGEEIAKNVNSYLHGAKSSSSSSSSSMGAGGKPKLSGNDNDNNEDNNENDDEEHYQQTVNKKDLTNMITTTSTTKTTTTATTTTTQSAAAAAAAAGGVNSVGYSENSNNTTDNLFNASTTMDNEEFQLLNTSELVITEETSAEVSDQFSGENPDSNETTTKPMVVLTRKTDREITAANTGGASSRIRGGGGGGGVSAPDKGKTNTDGGGSSSLSPLTKEKYDENTDWRDNMVGDQEYDKAEEEEKLMKKVQLLLYQPMAEMMSLMEKQNSQLNDQLKDLQEEVKQNLPKTFNDRLKTADQGIQRNNLQLVSVSQSVRDLYAKTDKLRALESTVNELRHNASASQQHDMPVTVNEHGKRVRKLERLMGIYKQSFDHYKNETKQEYKDIQDMFLKEMLNAKIMSKTLQKNMTSAMEKMIETYNVSQSPQIDDLKDKMKAYDQEVLIIKIDLSTVQRKLNGKTNKFDRELKQIREDVEQFSSKSWDLRRKTDSINRKFTALERRVNTTSDVISDLKTEVKLSMTDAWLQMNFDFDGSRSDCFGDQYVKKSKFQNVGYVGVVLCSETRYKILLGETLESKFLNIGDGDGYGQDHCEFVGGSPRNRVVLAPWKAVFGSERGYARNDWGEEPRKSMINAIKPTPKWYECGVTIP